MSDSLLRQLAMLRKIPRHPRKITAYRLKELLDDEDGFKITERTIQRDLQELSLEFALRCDDRERPFGWSWEPKSVLDVPDLDIHTALTFALIHRHLQPLLPKSTLKYLQPYQNRAEQVLHRQSRSRLSKWPNKIRVLPRGQKLLPAEIPSRVLNVVYEGLLLEKRFTADYQPREAEKAKSYEVNPLGLVFRESVVYLVCTLWDYTDIKQLALHRLKNVTLLDTHSRKPNGFDLDAYIASGEFNYPVEKRPIHPIDLKVLFDKRAAEHLYETKLSDDQKLTEQADGRVLVEATVLDTAELQWWLLGFGAGIEIVEPAEMREDFHRIAEKMASTYGA